MNGLIITRIVQFAIISLCATIDCSMTVKIISSNKKTTATDYTSVLSQRGVRGQNGHLLLDAKRPSAPEGCDSDPIKKAVRKNNTIVHL